MCNKYYKCVVGIKGGNLYQKQNMVENIREPILDVQMYFKFPIETTVHFCSKSSK